MRPSSRATSRIERRSRSVETFAHAPTVSASTNCKQRTNYKKDYLAADRQRRLEELPGWTWDPSAHQWEEGFDRLLEYVEHQGDACVPRYYKMEGFPLGKWVVEQCNRHAKGILTPDRKRRLEELPGWTWGRGPGEDTFDARSTP